MTSFKIIQESIFGKCTSEQFRNKKENNHRAQYLKG